MQQNLINLLHFSPARLKLDLSALYPQCQFYINDSTPTPRWQHALVLPGLAFHVRYFSALERYAVAMSIPVRGAALLWVCAWVSNIAYTHR